MLSRLYRLVVDLKIAVLIHVQIRSSSQQNIVWWKRSFLHKNKLNVNGPDEIEFFLDIWEKWNILVIQKRGKYYSTWTPAWARKDKNLPWKETSLKKKKKDEEIDLFLLQYIWNVTFDYTLYKFKKYILLPQTRIYYQSCNFKKNVYA